MGPNLQPYDFFVTRQKGFYSDFFTNLKSTCVLKRNGKWHIWEQNDAFEGWFKLSSTALKIITPYDLSNKIEAPVSLTPWYLSSTQYLNVCAKKKGNITDRCHVVWKAGRGGWPLMCKYI